MMRGRTNNNSVMEDYDDIDVDAIEDRALASSKGPSNTSCCCSCLSPIWRVLRHCCCRHGVYPLIVAPFVTAAFLLDVYSSLGCEFMTVNIGFEPSNLAWNQSVAELGMFYFKDNNHLALLEEEDQPWYVEQFHSGCERHGAIFSEYFINGDRTWGVSRIMAFIAAIAGLVATVSKLLQISTFRVEFLPC